MTVNGPSSCPAVGEVRYYREIMIPRRHVLVIGAEREAVERVAPMLMREEFQVVTASTSTTVMDLLRDTPFDLIVVAFPVQGIEIAELLRRARGEGSYSRRAGILLLCKPDDLEAAHLYVDHGANRAISLGWTEARLWRAFSDLLEVAPRAAVRSLVHLEVTYDDGIRRDVCRSVNISATGMLLTGPVAFRPGTELGITFRLPGEVRPLKLAARVVRVLDADDPRAPGFAIRFVSSPGDGTAAVRRFVERELRRRAGV